MCFLLCVTLQNDQKLNKPSNISISHTWNIVTGVKSNENTVKSVLLFNHFSW